MHILFCCFSVLWRLYYYNFISPNVVASVKQKYEERTITDGIKKTSEHANETTTTTIKMKKRRPTGLSYLYGPRTTRL